MQSKRQEALKLLTISLDMIIITLSWVLAYKLRFSGLFAIPKGIPDFNLYFKLIPFIAIIWFLVLQSIGIYKRLYTKRSALVEAIDLFQACFIAVLVFISFTWFYEEYRYSRFTVLIFAVIHPWFLILTRSLTRKFLRRYQKGQIFSTTLVITDKENMTKALQAIDDIISLDKVAKYSPPELLVIDGDSSVENSTKKENVVFIDNPSNWLEFLTSKKFDAVFFALSHSKSEFMDNNLGLISSQINRVGIIPDITKFSHFNFSLQVINSTAVINLNESQLSGLGGVAKRITDIVGALVGLILFSPIMLVLALLIRKGSSGGVFYKQERMGVDGKKFGMYKFRSMPIDAEDKTGAVWAQENDMRTTKIGKLMRKTSLDELPQLYNVLKGEMSLVGPRPEREVFVSEFRKNLPGYYLRHKVKTGCTGWAQVNGWRGNTSLDKRLECDLYYIKHWSFWFDIKIILLTIKNGFINKNAY